MLSALRPVYLANPTFRPQGDRLLADKNCLLATATYFAPVQVRLQNQRFSIGISKANNMFGLFSTKKKNDCSVKLRRLIDRTANWRIPEVETREAERCKRTMPIFLTPWRDKKTTAQEMETGISVDLSDHGLRVLLLRQPKATSYLVSIINMEDGSPEIYSFVADVCSCEKFAPGIASLGLRTSHAIETIELPPDVRVFLQSQIADFAINHGAK
jgi:hypothetical protein